MGDDPLSACTITIYIKSSCYYLSHHYFWAVYERGCVKLNDWMRVHPELICWILGYHNAAATPTALYGLITIYLETPLLSVLTARAWPIVEKLIRGREKWGRDLQCPQWGDWCVCRRYERSKFRTNQSELMLRLHKCLLNECSTGPPILNAPIDWW